MRMRAFFSSLIVLALTAPGLAQEKDIVETARSSDQFSTLVKAIEAAELAETLKSGGPFTVLAPTNEAFEKLPEGTLEEWLRPENKETLAGILKLHVIEGQNMASQVRQLAGQSVATQCPEGTELQVVSSGDRVQFRVGNTTASVEKPDIQASNGVIHAIDTVLMPPEN